MQTLPFDVLFEIFLHVNQQAENHFPKAWLDSNTNTDANLLDITELSVNQDDDRTAPEYRLLSPLEVPLLLCHVCSSWRTTTLAIPALWDSVYLPITYVVMPQPLRANRGTSGFKKLRSEARGGERVPVMANSLEKRSVQMVEWWEHTFLRHLTSKLFIFSGLDSAASALWAPSILLRRGQQADELPPNHSSTYRAPFQVFPLARFFSSTFFRLSKRIDINNLDRDVLELMHAAPASSSPFPYLVELRIRKLIYRRGNGERSDYTFPPSPSLRRLYASGHCENAIRMNGSANPLFPWSQLDRLSLSGVLQHDTWMKLLESCACINALAINPLPVRFDKSNLKDPHQPIYVRNLRRLVVGCRRFSIPMPFDEFIFTNLTSLRIVRTDKNDDWFESFHDIERFLNATPNLQELYFNGSLLFYQAFHFPFDNTPPPPTESQLSALVPHLRLMVISDVDAEYGLAAENIIGFLGSEWLCSGWDVTKSDSHKKISRTLEMHLISSKDEDIFAEVNISKVRRHFEELQGCHPAFDRLTVYEVQAAHDSDRLQAFDLDNLDNGWHVI